MADADFLTRVTQIGARELVLTDTLYEVAYKDDLAIYLFSITPQEVTEPMRRDFSVMLDLFNLDATPAISPSVPYTFSVATDPTPNIGTPATSTIGGEILASCMSTAVNAKGWAQHVLNPTPIHDQLAA